MCCQCPSIHSGKLQKIEWGQAGDGAANSCSVSVCPTCAEAVDTHVESLLNDIVMAGCERLLASDSVYICRKPEGRRLVEEEEKEEGKIGE